MAARGLRNNNPLNLEYGKFAAQMGATGSDGRFAIFPTMVDGVHAAAENLIGYGTRRKIDTIGSLRDESGKLIKPGVIETWAPGHENNVANYTQYVCYVCELKPLDKIDLSDPDTLFWLIVGMGQMEVGSEAFDGSVTDADVIEGVRRALA